MPHLYNKQRLSHRIDMLICAQELIYHWVARINAMGRATLSIKTGLPWNTRAIRAAKPEGAARYRWL
jgi:hypothetical protein